MSQHEISPPWVECPDILPDNIFWRQEGEPWAQAFCDIVESVENKCKIEELCLGAKVGFIHGSKPQ